MKATNRNYLSRVGEDLIVLLDDEPFYVHILAQMKKIMDTTVPVAGVSVINGQVLLFINPQTYFSYTRPERLFILKHEVLHVLFKHYLRRDGRDQMRWNYAADIAINQLIETSSCKMPADSLTAEFYHFPLNENAETYYNLLAPYEKNIPIPPELDMLLNKHEGSDEEATQTEESFKDNSSSVDLTGTLVNINLERTTMTIDSTIIKFSDNTVYLNAKHQPIPLTDLQLGDQVQIQLSKTSRFFSEALQISILDSLSNQNNPSNRGNENVQPSPKGLHPKWEDSSDVSPQVANSLVRSLVKDAANKSMGNLPSSIKDMVKDFIEPTVDWKRIFRHFIASSRSTIKSSTWRKQNRRLPDEVMGYKKRNKLLLAVAVDTSASISHQELQSFLSEIKRMFLTGADIVLIECDAALSSEPRKFTRQDATHTSFQFTGGGGTNFNPIFNYIDGKEIMIQGYPHVRRRKTLPRTPDAVIIFTDGIGPAPEEKPSYPTLWCLTSSGRKPSSWGTEVTITI